MRINAEVAGVEALDRQTAVDSLPGVASVTTSFTIILTLALVVITLVVGIFFVILTVQKTPSLTLLRAIGASGGALVRALLVQVAIIVAVGIAIGAAMLWVASSSSSARFPISFDPAVVLSRGLAVAVLSVLASLAAIRRCCASTRSRRSHPWERTNEDRGSASCADARDGSWRPPRRSHCSSCCCSCWAACSTASSWAPPARCVPRIQTSWCSPRLRARR